MWDAEQAISEFALVSGTNAAGFEPNRLGPGLMVYLDPLNRRAFLSEWKDAMEQPWPAAASGWPATLA